MLNYDNTGVTLELREIVESGVNPWAFEYPVPRSEIEYNGKRCKVDFDKAAFEKKILDHYWFRQIGQETPGRWLHYFRARILEIMPYYVQVYEFDAKFRNIEDPLESYNLTETFQQETQGSGRVTGESSGTTSDTTTGNTSSTSNRTENKELTNKFSDTPQGEISNLDTHLTNATRIDEDNTEGITNNGETSGTSSGSSSGTSSQESTDTGSVSHTLTRKGNIGVQPLGGEVQNIRSAFINIDMQIIDELKDLFLQVY